MVLRRAKRLRTLESMEVGLSQDQKEFVRLAVESGRLRDEGEAVRQALALWEERERARAELMAAVDAAEDSLARGRGPRVDGTVGQAPRIGREVARP